MRGAVRIFLLLLALAELGGCSGHKRAVMTAEPLPAQKDQQQLLLRNKVTSLMGKGNYRRAIELMCRNKHPGSPAAGLEQEYVAAVNGLVAAGEEYFTHGDYATAGRSFKWAIDSYPADPALWERLRWEPKQLKAHLEICSNRLMEEGLQEYRRGNLESAIRKWKGLIAFNAGHREAKKAIATATVQLRALKTMENQQQ